MRSVAWIILLATVASARQTYKFCAPIGTINDMACSALQKGGSEVSCLRVTDSAECAIRLARREADFGVFNAEELLLTYQFYASDIVPILQLKHKDQLNEDFEFQTVAVVRTDFTQPGIAPGNGFDHLRNGGLCHPGFGKSQWWNDYILKYFEKRVDRLQCQDDMTIAENELKNIKSFFGQACRPGEWVADSDIDQDLKKKYPELCALCDDRSSCGYNNDANHGHLGALQCLARGRGKVAYVALNYVHDYLGTNETFQFLCPNGVTQSLSNETPCAWLKQPWSVVAARKDVADALKNNLLDWLKPQTYGGESWKITLSKIIQEDSIAVDIVEKISLAGYLSKGREFDLASVKTCDRSIRWCTIGDLETHKCEWVARAAMALGIEPHISCVKSDSVFQCFRDIAGKRADIIVIDSNYGHLARTVYGLSTVLYSETELDRNSVIIAVVREPANFSIKNLHDLKGRTACFPEYGGISWLSFVNNARMSGIVSSKSCDYPLIVSQLFSGACTPGIKDDDHSRTATSTKVASDLCSVCWHRNDSSCSVNESNMYYGDKGAMQCLSDGAGDIAFVEAGNIMDDTADSNMFRILCKNGSLAKNPGLTFDEICAFSVTIDSEIIGRKNNSNTSTTDTILALLKIEDWLGYRVNTQRPIHIYDSFNGTKDLLFKDSTSGLVSTSSMKASVLEYKRLFDHVDMCTAGSFAVSANFAFVILIALYHLLTNHVH